MKRTITADSDTLPATPSTSTSSARKRPKTSQACVPCRKQKTRCELDSGTSRNPGETVVCHRCGVLGIVCVFDGSAGEVMVVRNGMVNGNGNGGGEGIGKEMGVRLNLLERATEALLAANRMPSLASYASSSSSLLLLPSTSASGSASSSKTTPTTLGTSPKDNITTPTLETSDPTTTAADENDDDEDSDEPDTTDVGHGHGPSLLSFRISSYADMVSRPPDLLLSDVYDRAGSRDWGAPMKLLQAQVFRSAGRGCGEPDGPIERGILDEEWGEKLLRIFQSKYEPWLHLPTTAKPPRSPLLDTVRFIYSLPHADTLPELDKLTAASRLSSLLDEYILWIVKGQGIRTPEMDEALLILATWSLPMSGQGGGGDGEHDGKRWLALMGCEWSTKVGSEGYDVERRQALKKMIWATQMMLSLGTHSPSHPTHFNIPEPPMSSLTNLHIDTVSPTSARSTRLLFLVKLLHIASRGLAIRNAPISSGGGGGDEDGLKRLSDRINAVLLEFEEWKDKFSPLQVFAESERPLFQRLTLLYNAYQILVVTHACILAQLLDVFEVAWKDERSAERRKAVGQWGLKAMSCSQSILAMLLTPSPPPEQGEGEGGEGEEVQPTDHMEALTAYSAIFLIKAASTIMKIYKESETLSKAYEAISRLMGVMMRGKATSNGAGTGTGTGRRYVGVVESMMRAWERGARECGANIWGDKEGEREREKGGEPEVGREASILSKTFAAVPSLTTTTTTQYNHHNGSTTPHPHSYTQPHSNPTQVEMYSGPSPPSIPPPHQQQQQQQPTFSFYQHQHQHQHQSPPPLPLPDSTYYNPFVSMWLDPSGFDGLFSEPSMFVLPPHSHSQGDVNGSLQ